MNGRSIAAFAIHSAAQPPAAKLPAVGPPAAKRRLRKPRASEASPGLQGECTKPRSGALTLHTPTALARRDALDSYLERQDAPCGADVHCRSPRACCAAPWAIQDAASRLGLLRHYSCRLLAIAFLGMGLLGFGCAGGPTSATGSSAKFPVYLSAREYKGPGFYCRPSGKDWFADEVKVAKGTDKLDIKFYLYNATSAPVFLRNPDEVMPIWHAYLRTDAGELTGAAHHPVFFGLPFNYRLVSSIGPELPARCVCCGCIPITFVIPALLTRTGETQTVEMEYPLSYYSVSAKSWGSAVIRHKFKVTIIDSADDRNAVSPATKPIEPYN